MIKTRTSTLHAVSVIAVIGLAFTPGCESDDDQGEKVSEEDAKLREKAGLYPAERKEARPDTARELKEKLDIETETDKPKTEQEIRDAMDLHPDSTE